MRQPAREEKGRRGRFGCDATVTRREVDGSEPIGVRVRQVTAID